MAEIVYILCALTSFVCAWLLLSNYRKTESKLLFWSGLGFVCIAISNFILVLDLMVVPSLSLYLPRSFILIGGLGILIYGLIWETT